MNTSYLHIAFKNTKAIKADKDAEIAKAEAQVWEEIKATNRKRVQKKYAAKKIK